MDVLAAARLYLERALHPAQGSPIALLLDDHATSAVSLATTQSALLLQDVFVVDRIPPVSVQTIAPLLLPSPEVLTIAEQGLSSRLDAARSSTTPTAASLAHLRHLVCVCVLRPTPDGLRRVTSLLNDPLFAAYHLVFTSSVRRPDVEQLADADIFSVVHSVTELFIDYLPIHNSLFVTGLIPCSTPLYNPPPRSDGSTGLDATHSTDSLEDTGIDTWHPATLRRSVDALSAVLLGLKKKPIVRFSRNSTQARTLAKDLVYRIHQQESALFDGRRPDVDPVLIVLDRRDDPITPLLMEWTYEAMVHELIGINKRRVKLSGIIDDPRPELREVILDPDHDQFYSDNMYTNIGDLGGKVKAYVDDYQRRHMATSKVDSIDEMRRFVEDYPEFRALSANVTKNVALVGELSRIVDRLKLMELSELEQTLAVSDSHATVLASLTTLIKRTDISNFSKVKVLALYALRYEESPQQEIANLLDLFDTHFNATADATSHLSQGQSLSQRFSATSAPKGTSTTILECLRLNKDERLKSFVRHIFSYAGAKRRQGDIFMSGSVFSRTRSVLKGFQTIDNVYTQHTPQFVRDVEDLINGKCNAELYPIMEPAMSGVTINSSGSTGGGNSRATANKTVGGNNSSGLFHAATAAGAKPQEIIVYIVGGITYGEAREFARLSSQYQACKIVCGGSYMLNTAMFVDSVLTAGFDGQFEKPKNTRPNRNPPLPLRNDFTF